MSQQGQPEPNVQPQDQTPRRWLPEIVAPTDSLDRPGDVLEFASGSRRTRSLTFLAAAFIVVGGYIHLCLYRRGYRFIPGIGVSFLAQIIGSAIIAVTLASLVGSRRVLHIGPMSMRLSTGARLSGLGISVSTLIAFWLTRTIGLFSFKERGLNPSPQALIALLAESAVVVLLGAALVVEHHRRRVAWNRIVDSRITEPML